MVQPHLINLESVQAYKEPFPHFTATATLDPDLVLSLLAWFEVEASWKLVETDFYEQYELDSSTEEVQTPLSFLTDRAFLGRMRQEAEGLFRQPFADRVDWSVHKLLPGQRIRIHNDLLATGETHRVVLNVNRGWSFSQGGFLMLFNSADPVDVHRVLMPLNGSLFGFEISEQSSHAVSLILDGERFTVVYSFYADI